MKINLMKYGFILSWALENININKDLVLIESDLIYKKEVLNKLPMEFAVEAQKLLEISLEGSVG